MSNDDAARVQSAADAIAEAAIYRLAWDVAGPPDAVRIERPASPISGRSHRAQHLRPYVGTCRGW
jgi:hypothetical protein